MSKFLAHDANFGRQIIKQMVHVMQPSVRINNLDSNLIEITVQFTFICSVLGFNFRSATNGVRRPSPLACVLGHAAAFAVNAVLVASQWQNHT